MRTKRHWFSLIAGIFFLACSIFMFANPSAPLTALGIFFSIIVFIGGVLETIRYFFTPASTRSVWNLISAIITVYWWGCCCYLPQPPRRQHSSP